MFRLADLLLAFCEVFNALSEASLQIACGYTEDATDLSRDTSGIGVYIVHFRQSSGKLA